MKVCPKCRAVYQDPGLNFCLEDGTPLQAQSTGAGAPPPTMPGGQVTFGAPPQGSAQPPSSAPGGFGAPQGFTMQPPPKKSSNWWLWAIIAVLAAIVACGGGFLILGLIGMSMDSANNSRTAPKNEPAKESRVFSTVDFSQYVFNSSLYADMEKDGESLTANTKGRTTSFVLTLPPGGFEVHGGGVTVTVTNLSGSSSTNGYGVVFHSSGGPREKDYIFVIDAERGEYRIAQNVRKVEKDVVKWTSSPAIKRGSNENVLEVEDKDGKLIFSINGTKVDEMKDDAGKSGDTIGVYFSDVKVVFSAFKTWR